MPARLTPLEAMNADALVTGDPRRAFALARELTAQPKMSHQARGLWGYTGVSRDGLPLTVQSTGIGGPSAATVITDLAGLGVKRLIRLGTCVAPPASHPAGRVILVESAIGLDGTSAKLAPGRPTRPDPGLQAALAGIAPLATVSSHDFPARHDPEGALPAAGASVRDLQTATVLAVAGRLGLRAAAVLLVTGDGEGADLGESDVNEKLSSVGLQVVDRLGRA